MVGIDTNVEAEVRIEKVNAHREGDVV